MIVHEFYWDKEGDLYYRDEMLLKAFDSWFYKTWYIILDKEHSWGDIKGRKAHRECKLT